MGTSLSDSQTPQMAITGIQTGLSHEGAGTTFLGIHGMYNANLCLGSRQGDVVGI